MIGHPDELGRGGLAPHSALGEDALAETSAGSTPWKGILAARRVAATDPLCTALRPFYWEIGDRSRVLASGSTGDGSVTRTTAFSIASASKWVFAAYVLERLSGQIDADTRRFLTLSAGYSRFVPTLCFDSPTVQACADAGVNEQCVAENDGKFFYGGGHYQKVGRRSWAGVVHEPGAARRVQGPTRQ